MSSEYSMLPEDLALQIGDVRDRIARVVMDAENGHASRALAAMIVLQAMAVTAERKKPENLEHFAKAFDLLARLTREGKPGCLMETIEYDGSPH